MHGEKPTLRSGAFAVLSRILHALGLVALGRPVVNGARLKVDGSGRPAFPFVRLRRERNGQILIYHRVNDEGDPYFGGIPTELFDRQMAYLASRFHVLPLSDLVERLRAGTLPDNAVAVTFDDGYRDNYLRAFPILTKHSLPATIFLTTSAIGSDRQLWHDDVFSAFRETHEPALVTFGPGRIQGPLSSIPERLRLQHEVLRYVRTLNPEGRSEAIAVLRELLRVGSPPPAPGLMLTWDEVRAMSRSGIEFGSHTSTHPILSRLGSDLARREILDSKRVIEERLGTAVRGFAYPNGTRADFLPETKAIVREAGYAYAVTTIPGTNEPEQDLFELRRTTPWERDVFAFGMRLYYNKLRS
jgi:peptidoglycan/xylan/chitin deacetylase (PgdA/CDA1 family)